LYVQIESGKGLLELLAAAAYERRRRQDLDDCIVLKLVAGL
jgi:hypothetical protein